MILLLIRIFFPAIVIFYLYSIDKRLFEIRDLLKENKVNLKAVSDLDDEKD
ncbi:MAG: hypothetical protein L0I93_03180 [Atopostipes suicloacalis]|nr:hypothetical protein [Atopostipes suicloacalis]